MKKLLFLLIIFGTFTAALAQRIYFDSSWAVTTKDHAVYYRETFPEGNLTRIKDFYGNGTLQMEALSSDPTPNEEIYQGKVTWYFPSGKVQSFATYNNGIIEGSTKSFDEKGRVLEDFNYGKDKFDGFSYSYKDPEQMIFSSSLTEYKNSETVKYVVFDEDINGIRKETFYKDYYTQKEKNYDHKGKLIAETNYDNEGNVKKNSTVVTYAFNPMRVSRISKYMEDGTTVAEEKRFYNNGKLQSEYKANKKNGKKIYYSENGTKTGELTFNLQDGQYYPQNGIEYTYWDSDTNPDILYQEDHYTDGNVLLIKNYSEFGKLVSATEYVTPADDYGWVKSRKFYDENGVLKSTLEYKDGQPYTGISLEDGETVYKDGQVTSMKTYDQSKNLQVEKKLIKDMEYETKVYQDKKLIYHYQSTDTYDGFSATVKSYNYSAPQTAVIKNSTLVSGKLKFKNSYGDGEKEYERTEKWVYIRNFDKDGTLTKETKILKNNDADDYYSEDKIYEEYLGSHSVNNYYDTEMDRVVAPPVMEIPTRH